MKIPQYLFLSLASGLLALAAYAHVVDYDDAPLGPLASPDWKQTFQPNGDTSQKFLFVNTAQVGRQGSHGVVVDVANAKSNARTTFQTGVAGNSYTISADFQVAINDEVPMLDNHNVLSIALSSTNEWFKTTADNSISLHLVRRAGGTRFGFTGIGLDASAVEDWRVVGFNANSLIGLPDTLPASGQMMASDWFTLSLTITNAGNDPVAGALWDVLGQIRNSSGEIIFSHEVKGRTLTEGFTPQSTLYGSVAVPFIKNLQTKSLVVGGMQHVNFDNFSLTAK